MAARCGAHDGLGSSQPPAGASADPNPERAEQGSPPLSGQGFDGFPAFL